MPGATSIVLLDGDRLVGLASCSFTASAAVPDPQVRGRGLSVLLAEAFLPMEPVKTRGNDGCGPLVGETCELGVNRSVVDPRRDRTVRRWYRTLHIGLQ
jgi:hypothetical protein